jgi:hypothetical protein
MKNPFQLYLIAFFGGVILNFILLIIVCNSFHFDSKSAICVYLYGGMGYLVKSFICSFAYFLFYNQDNLENIARRRLILWSPAILFLLWFFMVIFLQIEDFYTDISFGYIMRFPHFFIQLLSILIACTATSIYVKKSISYDNNSEANPN